ncbi:Ribonuclease 3 [Paraburkholderia humisilvae]|uniref:Ribonuclease 3 n=1 Tax=Paraburkholderia humisilvae TaxID=627669 RepID=A0A6J5DJR4_9BURK|nr:Ribonuclease 3 [Paraburkholderia humisilvae]
MPSSPLESRLRYEFRNAELLRQALTHRSHSATHNERLEFLGDSVLNCAVAALLFQRFGKLDEGDLSRVRANLVKQQSLYEIAQALNISDGLRLGEGELRSGGFRRPSILADTLEAILGAIFLDGGFEAAQTVIKRLYVPILDHIDPRTLGKDAKTLLQEYLQGHKIALPTYTVIATHGAAHNQQFEVECAVPKLDVKVSGSGASRRAAEQAAAKKALDEVMAAAPAVVAKPKRSKSARAAKHAEAEIVPGVTGVQTALDLRAPDQRRAERAARAEAKIAAAEAGAERVPAATAASVAPLAVIRAAHVEYSQSQAGGGSNSNDKEKPEKADKPDRVERAADKSGEKAAERTEDKTGRGEKSERPDKQADRQGDKQVDKPAEKHAERTDAATRPPDHPSDKTDALIRHGEKAADKPETAASLADNSAEKTVERAPEKAADKAGDAPTDRIAEKSAEKADKADKAAEKSAEKAGEKAGDKAADKLESAAHQANGSERDRPADKFEAASRSTERLTSRSREIAGAATVEADLEAGVASALHTRVADAGH